MPVSRQFFDLREVLATLQDKWHWIGLIALVVTGAALLHSLSVPATYRTTARLQVAEPPDEFANELSPISRAQFSPAIEIIRSGAVLRRVIKQRALHIEASPKYFPVAGRAIAVLLNAEQPVRVFPGLRRYAWGGERIDLQQLDVSHALQDEILTLTADEIGSYTLRLADQPILNGRVGESARGRGVDLLINELVARPRTQFVLVRHSWVHALDRLDAGLQVTEPENGILNLTLQGRSPAVADTLNTIMAVYLRQVSVQHEGAADTDVELKSSQGKVIVPASVPLRSFGPRRWLTLVSGLCLGLVLGTVIVLAHYALNAALRDPYTLEKKSGLPVYAIVPHSAHEKRLRTESQRPLLLQDAPADIAIESLRSLRTRLELLLLEVEQPIVVIGGMVPDTGKTFIVSNLAALFAQAGKRTVLIDADFRHGHLQQAFDCRHDIGLAELLARQATLDEVCHRDVTPGLDFIAGSELRTDADAQLSDPALGVLLDQLADHYDNVFISAPTLPGAAALGRLAPIHLIVVRSAKQTAKELSLVLSRFRQADAMPNGLVFNDFKLPTG